MSRASTAATISVLALILLLPGMVWAAQEETVSLSFEPSAVVAHGATPAGDVVFFSIAREPQGYFQRVARRQEILVADSVGDARFELEEATPLKSVWVAADLETGEFAIGAPPGFPLQEIEFPGRGFEVGAPGQVQRLRQRFSWVDMLVVRPQTGAWSLRAWDTSPNDRDGADDDLTTTSVEDLVPLGASPEPPQHYQADDIVVVINPRDLRFYATRLLGAPGEGGKP